MRGCDIRHFVEKLKSFDKGGNWVSLKCETNTAKTAIIRLEFCTPQIVHYSMLTSEAKSSKSDFIPLRKKWLPTTIATKETDNQLLIETSDLRVRIEKSRFAVSIYNNKENLIIREEPFDVTVTGSYNVEPLGFWTRGDSVTAVTDTFFLDPDERFYGFGEKFTSLNKKGQEITCWNHDSWGVMTEKSYINIPFFMSTKGYGIFVNSSCKTFFRMGSNSNVSYSFIVNDSILDFYLIYGPTLKDILYRYTDLTGRSSVPPKWSFGLWMSGGFLDIYKTRDSVEKLGEQLRQSNIPCDVLHIDPFWIKEGCWCSFEWDEDAFPNPEKMIETLHSKGFKVSIWENPYVPIGTKMFEEGHKAGYFLKTCTDAPYLMDPWYGNNPMAIVDFTNPKAVEWYKEKHKLLFEMGVDVMKTDFGEEIPENVVFYNGETGTRMHNIYSLLYNKAVFEATEKYTGRKGLVWSRSGFAGSQRYPTCWAGDPACTFASMTSVLRGGLSLALSGVPFWSHDIGGFGTPYKETPNPKLFIRWAQFGLFSPHSRCHGMKSRNPWDFGDKAKNIFRSYVKLRYKLLPYIYSYAFIASKTGLPLMRPLVLEYQDDPNTYDKDLEYLFGRELLIAPIFNENGRRSIYLPKNKWIDYWTRKEYNGQTTLDYKAPLEILPIFIKGDSIIPIGPEKTFIDEKPPDIITLDIYLYSKASFVLYEDDKVVKIKAVKNEGGINLDISKSERTWIAKFNKTKAPSVVRTNGKELRRCINKNEFEHDQEGWWIDAYETVYIKIKAKGEVAIKLTL
jgi:alpha-D-xyloside xylohydrolase